MTPTTIPTAADAAPTAGGLLARHDAQTVSIELRPDGAVWGELAVAQAPTHVEVLRVVATRSAGRANPTSSIGRPEAPPHAQCEEGAAAVGTAAGTSGGASAAGGAATAASLVNAAGGAAAEEAMAAEEAAAAAAAADDACGGGGSGGFDWESADVFSRVYFPKGAA